MSSWKNSIVGRGRAVLMMPTLTRNPYNAHLAEALERLGWSVSLGKKGPLLPLTTTWLRRGRPRIIHLHWTHSLIVGSTREKSLARAAAFQADVLRLRSLGVKFVWTVHNLSSHKARDSSFEATQHRWLVEHVDAVTIHCESARPLVAATYQLDDASAAAIHVVPHASYIGTYPDRMSRAQARALQGYADQDFVYLFLGDIKKYKGVTELIEAFRMLPDSSARLLIAGAASKDMSRVLAEATKDDDRISIHPKRVPDRDIERYMNSADVVVLPFRSVLTSGSALLAMSFGKALVVPKIGCVADTLDARGAEMLPPMWDVSALREALITVRSRDVAAMGAHNLSIAKTQTWDQSAAALSAVFDSL